MRAQDRRCGSQSRLRACASFTTIGSALPTRSLLSRALRACACLKNMNLQQSERACCCKRARVRAAHTHTHRTLKRELFAPWHPGARVEFNFRQNTPHVCDPIPSVVAHASNTAPFAVHVVGARCWLVWLAVWLAPWAHCTHARELARPGQINAQSCA